MLVLTSLIGVKSVISISSVTLPSSHLLSSIQCKGWRRPCRLFLRNSGHEIESQHMLYRYEWTYHVDMFHGSPKCNHFQTAAAISLHWQWWLLVSVTDNAAQYSLRCRSVTHDRAFEERIFVLLYRVWSWMHCGIQVQTINARTSLPTRKKLISLPVLSGLCQGNSVQKASWFATRRPCIGWRSVWSHLVSLPPLLRGKRGQH